MPKLDISAWLERYAIEVARISGKGCEQVTRLREAAAELRKLRADLVTARMGKAGKI